MDKKQLMEDAETQGVKRILSLGAGVQSSTLALMYAVGELSPMPDAAIFADTGDEPHSVYAWLDWLETQLPYPVYRLSGPQTLAEKSTTVRTSKGGRKYLAPSLPVFISRIENKTDIEISEDGEEVVWAVAGRLVKGMGQRQCTREFKIDRINRKVRELAKVKRGKGGRAIVYIGISMDEALRMKPSRVPWITNEWPLIDKKLTREDCLKWMESRGYPKPPRSACVYCPFHSDKEWKRLKDEDSEGFAAAVAYESRLQNAYAQTSLDGTPFLHASRKPLPEVDFTDSPQQDMFNNECEGMCGV